jgi:hypothetical protein
MESKNLAVIGLVLGILSLVLAFIIGLVIPFIPLVLGIVGLILSSKAGKIEKTGMGTAGFVLSIIGLILSALFLIIWIACVAAIGATGLGLAALLEATQQYY